MPKLFLVLHENGKTSPPIARRVSAYNDTTVMLTTVMRGPPYLITEQTKPRFNDSESWYETEEEAHRHSLSLMFDEQQRLQERLADLNEAIRKRCEQLQQGAT